MRFNEGISKAYLVLSTQIRIKTNIASEIIITSLTHCHGVGVILSTAIGD